jgi:hypothetical protein
MKIKKLFPLTALFILLLLSGCFEIVEDITIHADGSGTFLYKVNLSQSKVRLDALMKLDSSDGYRIPPRQETDADILKAKSILEKSQGITNVSTTTDWINYIYTIKFDFNSINNLNLAVEKLSQDMSSEHKRIPEATDNFAYGGKSFDRKNHYDGKANAKNITAQDRKILENASYTCIYRFDVPVQSCSNKEAVISKNGKSVMLKLNMLQLALGQKTVANKITLQ